jgi:hypothetical protein
VAVARGIVISNQEIIHSSRCTKTTTPEVLSWSCPNQSASSVSFHLTTVTTYNPIISAFMFTQTTYCPVRCLSPSNYSSHNNCTISPVASHNNKSQLNVANLKSGKSSLCAQNISTQEILFQQTQSHQGNTSSSPTWVTRNYMYLYYLRSTTSLHLDSDLSLDYECLVGSVNKKSRWNWNGGKWIRDSWLRSSNQQPTTMYLYYFTIPPADQSDKIPTQRCEVIVNYKLLIGF